MSADETPMEPLPGAVTCWILLTGLCVAQGDWTSQVGWLASLVVLAYLMRRQGVAGA